VEGGPGLGSGRSPTEVAVLACDYVEGKMIGGGIPPQTKTRITENAEVVFAKIGLNDLGGE
jgi:hypothetical protein